MFEGLNWKNAARRSAVVIAIYLGLLYLLGVAFPDSGFSLDNRGQVVSLLINAVFFFFVFTFVYAFVERSRTRRIEEARRQKAQKPAREEGEAGDGELRGRPNPNTSRKKARRKR